MTEIQELQRDYMRRLVQKIGIDKDAVCKAYCEAELDDLVQRPEAARDLSLVVYADALWSDGEANGWIGLLSDEGRSAGPSQ